MEATVLTAPADGIAPAVLLSLGGAPRQRGLPGQYLFNVPEGFSRLALEHRVRPGLHLRALFAANACGSLAGAGSLLMRLRGEGHGQLHVVGPPGTQAMLGSLRHFIRWRHPALLLSEITEWEQPVVFEDEHIAVAALWRPALVMELWRAPAWLAPALPGCAAKEGASSGKAARSGSSSEGNANDSSEESSSSSSSSSSESETAENSSSSTSSSESEPAAEQQAQGQQNAAGGGRNSVFEELDRLLMAGAGQAAGRGCGRTNAGAGRGRGSSSSRSTAKGSTMSLHSRTQVLERLKIAAGAAQSAPRPAAQEKRGQHVASQQLQQLPRKRARTAPLTAAPAAAPQVPPAAAGQAAQAESDVFEVGGRLYRQLNLPGISGYTQHKVATAAAAAAGQQPQDRQDQQAVLAFLCHVKSTDQLLLLTQVPTASAAAALAQHPALPLLQQQGSRVAAVLHSAGAGVASSRQFKQLMQQLQPPAQAKAGSSQQQQQRRQAHWQQVLMEHPGQHKGQQRADQLGHLATARTTARLNLISPRLFPLPHAAAPAGTPASLAGAGAFVLAGSEEGGEAGAHPPGSSAANLGNKGDRQALCTAGDSACPAAAHSSSPADHGEQQLHNKGQAEGSAGRQAGRGGAEHTGPISLQHITHVLCRQQQQPAQNGSVQPPSLPALQLRPAEAFDQSFDAASRQQEVLQERPELQQQLDLLEGQQQLQPVLPLLRAQPPGSLRCPPNTLKPPPPPLPPLLPPQHLPAILPALQGALAAGAQQGAAPRPLVPTLQQQQQGVRQGRVMRPTYHSPGALPWQQPWPVPVQAPRVQPSLGQPPDQQAATPPAAASLPAPQAQASSQRQQQQQQASNKGAASALRERLTGQLTRQPELHEQQHADPADAAEQRAAEPAERLQQVPAWLRGAPACLQQLALSCAAAPATGTRPGRSTPATSDTSVLSTCPGAACLGDGCPEVTFLGTGSAEPSKYRGPSAIHLRMACGRGLLMDCGEGTLGQLVRMHGHRQAMRLVAGLACVWISHRHADHMSGVLPLLAALPRSAPPLLVLGPGSLRDWLAEAAPAAGLAQRYCFVHCSELRQPGHWAHAALCKALELSSLSCVPVRHCSDAWALVLRAVQGWSLAYSGDTQPCEALVRAAQGVTLLIHEATFEPCLAQQAQQKRHSTTAEALGVAQRMGAYRTILTHFSQRYPKWPEGLPMPAPASSAAGAQAAPAPSSSEGSRQHQAEAGAEQTLAGAGVAVAFDGMRVPLLLLPVLPLLMPAVRAALADQEEGQEGAAATTVGEEQLMEQQ